MREDRKPGKRGAERSAPNRTWARGKRGRARGGSARGGAGSGGE